MRRALTAALAFAGLAAAGCAGTRGLDAARLPAEPHSRLTVATAEGPVEVVLVGENLKRRRLNATYCGGPEGAREVTGRWRLLSVREGAVVSDIALHADIDQFIEGQSYDGLQAFREWKLGHTLLLISQYASCIAEEAWFFRLGVGGRLHAVAFRDQDGREWRSRLNRGELGPGPDGGTVFCVYDRRFALELCDAYAYDGVSFVQVASWIRDREVAGSCSEEGYRAAWEFFTALQERDYRRAAYYGGRDDRVVDDLEERARDLASYCRINSCHKLEDLHPSPPEVLPGDGGCEVKFFDAESAERLASFFVHVRRIGQRHRVYAISDSIR